MLKRLRMVCWIFFFFFRSLCCFHKLLLAAFPFCACAFFNAFFSPAKLSFSTLAACYENMLAYKRILRPFYRGFDQQNWDRFLDYVLEILAPYLNFPLLVCNSHTIPEKDILFFIICFIISFAIFGKNFNFHILF
jgi:hypothetical protein